MEILKNLRRKRPGFWRIAKNFKEDVEKKQHGIAELAKRRSVLLRNISTGNWNRYFVKAVRPTSNTVCGGRGFLRDSPRKFPSWRRNGVCIAIPRPEAPLFSVRNPRHYFVIRMSLHPLTKTVCRKFWRSVRHAPPETAYSQA